MFMLPSFDHLKDLYIDDPDAFETLRTELVNNYIETASTERQQRLIGLQFQINSRRELSSNPMHSCIALSRMMHETFWDMRCSLETISDMSSESYFLTSSQTLDPPIEKKPSAAILELKQLN
ncbi:MAG: DUF3135 domain-containing protein [Pseudomonadales bacterium]|nr:DUF3135 domain-containing protein [Pseudomonadales bacterium]NRA17713.1 DUF3135 domain-containing protein [Oceanospirillaceae bacterium]